MSWPPCSVPVAAHLPGVGAERPVRHGVGLPPAPGGAAAGGGAPGLAGECDLRPGPGGNHGRHHLRHPALRSLHHGLDEPVRARLPERRGGPAGGLCPDRAPGGRSDVPPGVVQDPGIAGLSATLPATLCHGLVAHGVPSPATAPRLPPVSTRFAAFLGYSPIRHLVGTSILTRLPAHQAAVLTGRGFFPALISAPFASGLHAAFDFAIGACLIAAGMSWLRGGKYHYREYAEPTGQATPVTPRLAEADIPAGDRK